MTSERTEKAISLLYEIYHKAWHALEDGAEDAGDGKVMLDQQGNAELCAAMDAFEAAFPEAIHGEAMLEALLPPVALAGEPVPVLYGDGVHNDTAAAQAAVDGRPYRRIDTSADFLAENAKNAPAGDREAVAATEKAMAALDVLADQWAHRIELDHWVFSLANSSLTAKERCERIDAFCRQCYAEGAYDGHTAALSRARTGSEAQ